MANQGLKKKVSNLEFEVGIIKAYLNINSNDSNLIFDFSLIKMMGLCPINFNLYYNHQRKNEISGYNLKGFSSIYDMNVSDYGNIYQVLFPDNSYYQFHYDSNILKTICDENGYILNKIITSQIGDSDIITYEIIDKNNNIYKIDEDSQLYEIEDNSGNICHYDVDKIYIDLSDDYRRKIELSYQNNVLNELTYYENNLNQKNVIINTDIDKRITGIIIKFGNEIIDSYSIEYGNNYIKIYSNIKKYGYKFVYDNNNKFIEVDYIHNDITNNNQITYDMLYQLSYDNNKTEIEDEYGNINNYYFDNLDNLILIKNHQDKINMLRNDIDNKKEYEISFNLDELNNNIISLNDFTISNISKTLTLTPNPYIELSSIYFYSINKINNNQSLTYNINYSNINTKNVAIIFLIKNENGIMDNCINLKLDNNIKYTYNKKNYNNYHILGITLDKVKISSLKLEINDSISNIIISDMIIINDSDSNQYKYDLYSNLIEDINNKYTYTSNNRIKEIISKNKYESYVYFNNEYRCVHKYKNNGLLEINKYSNVHKYQLFSFNYDNGIQRVYDEVEEINIFNNPTDTYINQYKKHTTYTYDNYQRVTTKKYENDEYIDYTYNNKSQCATLIEGTIINGSTHQASENVYTYDTYNNISNVLSLNQSSLSIDYLNNLLSKIKLNNNNIKEYEYDNKDRIIKIIDNINTLHISYNVKGDLSILELKNNNNNQTIHKYYYVYDYDLNETNRGLLRKIKDINNNILKEYLYNDKDEIINDIGNNLEIDYQYDDGIELIKYKYNDSLKEISYINDLSNYIGYSPEVLDNYKSYNSNDYFCYFYKDYYLKRSNNNLINTNRTFERLYKDRVPCIKIDNTLEYYVNSSVGVNTICFWIYPKSLSNQTILEIEQEFDDGEDTVSYIALKLEYYNNKIIVRTSNTSNYSETTSLNIDSWNYIGFSIVYGNELNIVVNNNTYHFNIDYTNWDHTSNIHFNNNLEKYIAALRYSLYLRDIDDLINYYAITKKYIIERYEYINKESKIQYFNNDNVLNIIPLNNRLTNYNGIPYYESFNDKMNTLFLYDKTNKREYLFVNKNIIKYSIPSNTKKISFKFKMVFRRERHDIIKFNFSNNYVILFIENNILKLSINNNIVSTNENMSYNTWIELGVELYNTMIGLSINNTVYSLSFSTNCDKEIELGSINYPLYGYIGDIFILNNTGNNPSSIYSELKYDEFDRLVERRNNIISNKYVYIESTIDDLAYLEQEVYKEIIKFGNTEYEREYQYDNRGNLTKIIDSYFGNHDYKYNQEDYLVNDEGTTNKYHYDSNGNISVTGDSYQYDSVIKDKLSSFNSYNLSYDDNYNITYVSFISTYDNNRKILNITYEGKKIKTLTVNNIQYNYEYNELGLRKSKNNILYYYENKTLIREVNGNNTIDYLYDNSDYLIGFRYNNQNYYYVRDCFGIILGIVDYYGTIKVKYDYDGYGNPIITYDSNNIASINNILYKGYYYDKESGLYYLINRYYNPRIRRFMSLDSIEYLNYDRSRCFNLYAYCNNNPVMYSDLEGEFGIFTMLLVGIAIGVSTEFVSDLCDGNGIDHSWRDYLGAGVAGGIGGLASGLGLGLIGSTLFAMAGDTTGGFISGDIDSWGSLFETLLVSACTSLISCGISSSVRKKYAEYQYAAIRGYSANNNKVNKMLGRYVGKQYRALSKLKIGSNTKAEFLKALYETNANETVDSISSGITSILLGIWF